MKFYYAHTHNSNTIVQAQHRKLLERAINKREGGGDDSAGENYEDNGLYGTFDPNESGSREEEGGSSRGGSREYGYGESAPPSTISLDGEDLGEREIESPSSRVAVIRF